MHRDCRKFVGVPLLRRIREPPMYCLFVGEHLRMKIHKSALAALIVTLYCGAAAGHSFAAGSPAASSTVNAAPTASSAIQGPGDLGALVAAGTLPDLRWPNFTDYRDSVKKFYDAGGYSLAWIQNGKASPQAVSMILLFQQAAIEGSHPRGLRRLAMGCATGQATTYCAEAVRHRPCAYRFGADGLRDALHFRLCTSEG